MRKCPKCGVSIEDSSYCKRCFSEYHKKWYEQNKTVQRKNSKEYSRKYRRFNKEKYERCRTNWNKKHPSYHKDYAKDWRLKNKQRVRKYNKRYRELNKEKEKIRRYAYRKLRDKMIKNIGHCEKCRNGKDLQIHHIDYSSNNNLMLLCRSCHRKEHNVKTF